RGRRRRMTTAAIASLENQSVSYAGTTYDIRPLAPDTFTVLVEGVPVGRIVYTFGAANGVPEGDAISEDALTTIAEAWFAVAEG
ncbi:MAG: hypothetical protein ABW321_23575, partial [Polyangiales bacterium]